jgi:hypothetical protein
MTILLLILQLLTAKPITNSYAGQVKKDVVISVTFTDERPTRVCSYLYATDDEAMAHSIDAHCYTPKNDIGIFDLWPNMRLDEGNWKVIITYPHQATDVVYLVARVNS